MNDLYIIKIGGSVCTKKDKNKFEIKKESLARLGSEIREAQKEKSFRLIIIVGVGPFGHLNVTNYNIDNGLSSEKDYQGFIKTVCDCNFVNYTTSEIFRKKGLLIYPMPSNAIFIQKDKEIVDSYLSVIKELWKVNEKIVPVLNGTMCPDLELKGSVISGDSVLEHLAKNFKTKKIIFATDVDGIYDRDSKKYKNAKLIREINFKNLNKIKKGISGSSATDVTKGMLGKVNRIIKLSKLGIICQILNGLKKGYIKKALLGERVKGTVITK